MTKSLTTFPDPKFKPLYTCRLSAEMISPLKFLASLTATSDLPDEVGPIITMILGFTMDIFVSILRAGKKAMDSHET